MNLLSLMNILEVEGCVHRVCSALTNGHNNRGTLLFKKLVSPRPHNLHSPQQSTAEQMAVMVGSRCHAQVELGNMQDNLSVELGWRRSR